MKYLKIVSVAVILLTFGCKSEIKEKTDSKTNHKEHQIKKTESTKKKKSLSPHTSTMAMVGDAHIHIDYSSPGVRDRIIFGGLVGYNNVWQAGAHMATWIETNKDLQIDGKTLPAGKYGFFTIPSKGDWTIMINKNWEQHGKDEYDEKEDVLRFTVSQKLSENIQEHLEYKITKKNETEGAISLSWEKVTISFPFEVK
ncbi:MAG: DUF2911 domain-containing protein [Flavobacteriaceae bacterium]|nr:DUF2911 domain-containing protein [Flavobacteriaceae bacterium]